MSSYDFEESAPAPEKPKGSSSRTIYNVLTILALLASLCLCLIFASIFINPNSALNPFPPPTQVGQLILPTATWTPLQLPATWTPTVTYMPSATFKPQPSVTPGIVNTEIVLVTPTSRFTPTATRQPTVTPKPTGAPFSASVVAVDSTIVHPDLGCNWWGVGGTAVDLKGNPIVGLVVKLGGFLNGKDVSQLTVTGTVPVYGQGGYEFKLGDAPQTTTKALYVQLMDQAGLPVSEQIYFNTATDCTKNLTLVRFKQVR